MSRGLPREDRNRVWNEAVYVLGKDRGLVGSVHVTGSDVIHLEEPTELLPLGEHYAMIRRLNAIQGVETVYMDNGARAEPGGAQPSVRARGGVREFIRNFLGALRFEDI